MDNEKIPMIYGAICGVMESIGAVGKNDVNKQQGFKYRSIEAVMNALNPALVKNNIFCTPEVLEQHREERTTAKGATLIYSVCRIRYRFYAVDGSFVDAVVVGEGMETGILKRCCHCFVCRFVPAVHAFTYCNCFNVTSIIRTETEFYPAYGI